MTLWYGPELPLSPNGNTKLNGAYMTVVSQQSCRGVPNTSMVSMLESNAETHIGFLQNKRRFPSLLIVKILLLMFSVLDLPKIYPNLTGAGFLQNGVLATLQFQRFFWVVFIGIFHPFFKRNQGTKTHFFEAKKHGKTRVFVGQWLRWMMLMQTF